MIFRFLSKVLENQFPTVKLQAASDWSKLECRAPLHTHSSKNNVYTQMSSEAGIENKLAAPCAAALTKESLTV